MNEQELNEWIKNVIYNKGTIVLCITTHKIIGASINVDNINFYMDNDIDGNPTGDLLCSCTINEYNTSKFIEALNKYDTYYDDEPNWNCEGNRSYF